MRDEVRDSIHRRDVEPNLPLVKYDTFRFIGDVPRSVHGDVPRSVYREHASPPGHDL